jgi:hypothetical protein
MRRVLPLIIALLLTTIPIVGIQGPATLHAAPAQARKVSFTGRLIATPANTNLSQPVSLVVQLGNHAVLVWVTSQTQLVDSDSATINLGILQQGDRVRVVGSFSNGQFIAAAIRDLSQPKIIALQFNGTVGSVPSSNLLCVANTSGVTILTPNAQAQTTVSCPTGQTPVYLRDTRIINEDGSPITLSDLQVNDTLLIKATLDEGRITASLIKDTMLKTTAILTGTGTVGSVSPGLVCVANFVFSVITPNARTQIATVCPTGQTPIYVIGSTKIVNADKVGIPLSALQQGDSLNIKAALVLGKITASLIQDTTTQQNTTTLTGVLNGTPANTNLEEPADLLLLVGGTQEVLVVVTNQTHIVNHDGLAISLSSLQNGQTLQVTGVLDNGKLTASMVRDESLPAPTALQLKGQFASMPSAGVLCLANTQTLGALTPSGQAQIASPCPTGQTPIYLTTATVMQDGDGDAITTQNLQVNDVLLVQATLANGQISAAQITDTSIPT